MIVRIDKIGECLSLTNVLMPMVRVFVTDDSDIKGMADYATGSEAHNITTDTRWMFRPDGYWHKVGTDETIFPANIFGVSWVVGVSSKLTRTDGATNFEDPVPCVNGVGGSSPFDDIMPWSGMKVVQDDHAGTMVAIPKYYYRIVREGDTLSVQISSGPAAGFAVSPAHMDRGDGKGERDVVYIARYHCDTTGQSTSGSLPWVDMTREQFRLSLGSFYSQFGANIYSMQDFAMWWTVRLLMLVEYANWNFQDAIGYGCGNGESLENSGKTDSMPYHTGTVGETIDTYCVGVQYRYIEDMWGNCAEFIDGWRMDMETASVYVTLNPAEFSDNEGGVMIAQITEANQAGWITDWSVPEAEGYSWAMMPAATNMDESLPGTDYVADYCEFGGPVLGSGGIAVGPIPNSGPFMLCSVDASVSVPFFGARLQKIP